MVRRATYRLGNAGVYSTLRAIEMKPCRVLCSILVLMLISTTLVPLCITSTAAMMDFPMTHQQWVRLAHASSTLLFAWFFIQIGIVWLLYSAVPRSKAFGIRVISFIGLQAITTVLTFLAGVYVTDFDPYGWYKFAAKLFL